MDALGIVIVLILSLWSITKTLEKMTDKILDSHKKQNELLEDIKSKLEEKQDE
ncbi:hypothetical protein [Metabacillus litoralis]|uniref:hypothetical protein n=1 Tax=Metabacillus litoralis TaxID=152268 RepID=UPI001CFCB72F|nr:hypothetical protein [Metabacillus litoralis]